MRKRSCLLLVSMILTACMQAAPAKRPVQASAQMAEHDVDRRFVPATGVADLPERLRCDTGTGAETRMQQSVVAELVGRGELYAALAQVETLPRDQAEVALLRADILSQLDVRQAASWYQLLLASCLAGRAEHGLARIEADQGQIDSALARLQRAVKAHPVDPAIRHDLGVVWMQHGQLERAHFELRTAEELARDDPRPRMSLMLLALLEPSPQAWRDAVARWQPDASTRNMLHARCRALVAQGRQGSAGHCVLALQER